MPTSALQHKWRLVLILSLLIGLGGLFYIERGMIFPSTNEEPAVVDNLAYESLKTEEIESEVSENPTALSSYSACAQIDFFHDKSYVTFTIIPQLEKILIFNQDSGGAIYTFKSIYSVAEKRGENLFFAMNGGMFNDQRTGQGLLIIDHEIMNPLDTNQSGYGNFYMQPNGVFAVDSSGMAHIVLTEKFDSLSKIVSIKYATQSGPMMLVDGSINEQFNEGSPNLHIRNAVGVTPDGKLVFAISREVTTFYELSSVLLQAGCHQALYLDGAISKVYLPVLGVGKLNEGENLGPIIALFR